MSILNILSDKGHDTLEWDANDEIQIKNVEKKFNEMLEKGYTAFKTDPVTKKSVKITKFDPLAEEITMGAPTQKG